MPAAAFSAMRRLRACTSSSSLSSRNIKDDL